MEDPGSSLKELAGVIEHDQAIVARVSCTGQFSLLWFERHGVIYSACFHIAGAKDAGRTDYHCRFLAAFESKIKGLPAKPR